MPNAAARRTRKANPVAETANETETGVKIMSTLTAGDFAVEELGDYEFTRTGAGRKREPSPFDDLVNEWAGQATRRIPVANQEEAQEAIKLLQKACEYRSRGLNKRTEEMDGQLYVVFRIDTEKAKRAPRKPRETDSAEAVESAVYEGE